MKLHTLGQVMLYVQDVAAAMAFWTDELGFTVIADSTLGQMRRIEVAPSSQAQTSLVLLDKDLVAKMDPDLNLGTPSLMFFTADAAAMRQDLISKGIQVGTLMEMAFGKVFNFADREDNYFAVLERPR